MSKESIKGTIDANIKQNGQGLITGIVMNSVLKDMVDDEYSELGDLASKTTEIEGEIYGGAIVRTEWLQGSLASTSSTTRIRTSALLLPSRIHIKANDGYKFCFRTYRVPESYPASYTREISWTNELDFSPISSVYDVYYAVMLKKDNDTNITPVESVNCTIIANPGESIKDDLQLLKEDVQSINDILTISEERELPFTFEWEQGAIYPGGGLGDSSIRIRTKLATITQDISIKCINGAVGQYGIVAYEEDGITMKSNSGWLTSDRVWRVTDGNKIRLTAKKGDNTIVPNENTDIVSTYQTQLIERTKDVAEIDDVLLLNRSCILSFAHRGYDAEMGIGHNKVSDYINAVHRGFNGGETDLYYRSSDGVIMASHDPTFVSNGVTITIAEKTLAELKALDYYGGTIATAEEVIAICKKVGLKMILDKGSELPILFSLCKKYGMLDNVYWTEGYEVLNGENYYNGQHFNFVLSVYTFGDRSAWNAIARQYPNVDFYICGQVGQTNLTDLTNFIANITSPNLKAGVWDCNSVADFRTYSPYCSLITSNNTSDYSFKKETFVLDI